MNRAFLIGFFIFISFQSFGQTRIEAENFSTMSGVSVEDGWGDGGGQNIAPIDQGDWMEYLIHPTISGVHTFIFRYGAITDGSQLKIKNTDGTVLATVDLPNTNETYLQSFHSIAVNLSLTAGEQTIRIESTAATQWIFNWFEYSYGYKLEAELYSNMYGIALASTADAGGGFCVGYIDAGEWMDYSVNIPHEGTYAVKLRFAATQDNVHVQIKNSGGNVLAEVTPPNTNGWDIWTTVDANITLPAGQQTLRIYAVDPGWNINWWVLLPPSNPAPIVNAGTDQTITLPTTSITLNGSASDGNGTIASYVWNEVSGPNTASLSSSSTPTTTVSNLVEGTYVFKLTATDNEGAPGMDEVTVTVNAAPSGSAAQWLTNGNSYTNGAQFIGTTDNQPLIFKTNNKKWAELTTGGVFTAKKIKVQLDGFADFVFDSTYKLLSLPELERYISAYRHLPDVPSEKEVLNGGLDVGDNQAVLLRKIEELTLYVIEMNKKLEQLSEENKELKKQTELKNK